MDSYGRLKLNKGESGSCPFRYQGQYEDVETGLYYNRFRYYSPEEGLYISQDPIGLYGGSRFYNYIGNPNKYIDPLGLSSTCAEQAKEAHEQLDPMAQKFKTTAIGEDSEGNKYIASSDNTVPKPQREWAEEKGITVVNGKGHAEETLMNSGNNIVHIDASRGVCSDCESQMKNQGVTTNTKTTGKQSKNRR